MSDYRTMKKRADKLAQEVAEAEGVRKSLLKMLKEDFGCETLEEGERKLKKMKRLEAKQKETAERLLENFREDWADELDEED